MVSVVEKNNTDKCLIVSLKVSNQTALEAKGHGQRKFTSGKWNPNHNCTQIATANDTCIRGWDLRTMRSALKHGFGIGICNV